MTIEVHLHGGLVRYVPDAPRDVVVVGQGRSTLPPLVLGASAVVQEQHQE